MPVYVSISKSVYTCSYKLLLVCLPIHAQVRLYPQVALRLPVHGAGAHVCFYPPVCLNMPMYYIYLKRIAIPLQIYMKSLENVPFTPTRHNSIT